MTAPSENVGVTEPQLSVAVAEPSAASICAAVGLHPNDNVVPVAVITGAVLSITEIVCEAVDVFPHASVAVHFRVTE
jgi:hypothetical protein